MNVSNDVERTRADIAYQVAIQMLIYEGNLVWNRFNVFVVANSIIIFTIGVLATSEVRFKHFTLLLIPVGIFFCLLWSILTNRGFLQFTHHHWSAIDLEERYSSQLGSVMSKTKDFGEGKKINYKINGIDCSKQLKWIEQKLSVRLVAKLTIRVFIAIYIILFRFLYL